MWQRQYDGKCFATRLRLGLNGCNTKYGTRPLAAFCDAPAGPRSGGSIPVWGHPNGARCPGMQFNRHFEFWAQSLAQNCATFSTGALQVKACLKTPKRDLGQVLGLILDQQKCLLNCTQGCWRRGLGAKQVPVARLHHLRRMPGQSDTQESLGSHLRGVTHNPEVRHGKHNTG